MGAVGERLKQCRESRQLSHAALAERSDLPEALIHQMEQAGFVPPLSPLVKVGRALGLRVGTFLDDAEQPGPAVNRRSQASRAPRIHHSEQACSGDLAFHPLAKNKVTRHMEPLLVTVQPAADAALAASSHEGEEFLYVLKGAVELIYGQETYRLDEGDSIYFDSIVPHRIRALGAAPASLLAVVYDPF